jgi:two-component sensor histidine kinase/uncharacterized membrane protein YqaE (UPF0057 family)
VNERVVPRVTLRSQILRIVVAALLPLIAVALWQGAQAVEDSRNAVTARLKTNARIVAEQEREPFTILKHTLTFAAALPEVREIGARCSATLAGALQGTQKIANFVRTDSAGLARCSGLEFTPGEDLSGYPWWRERAGRRTLYVASPEIGAISRRLILITVLPLFSTSGAFQGTLSAGVSISDMARSIKAHQARLPGAVLLTDEDGAAMIPSEKVAFARLEGVMAAQDAPQTVTALNGTRWTYVSAPVYDGQIMVVYAEPANSVIRAAWTRLLPSLLLPMLALVLTSGAIWFVVRRSIVRWLDQLRQVTGRIAAGDYAVSLGQFAAAPSELADFAADLTLMARAIDEQETSLRRAYHEKSVLMREVNHRVKNNLQIIASLLALQSANVKDTKALNALNQARMRIGGLGLIYRLLYEGEQDEDHGQVDVSKLVSELCAQLSTNYRNRASPALECQSQEFFLGGEPAIPLTLLIVEAVTNAYHHAFADYSEGVIFVRVLREGDTALLEIADNGVGFVVGSAAGGTIGLNLMQAYTEQIDGKLDISSGAQGSVISVRFPIVN